MDVSATNAFRLRRVRTIGGVARAPSGAGGGGDVPVPPDGFDLVTHNGDYVTHSGAYVVAEIA